MDEPPGGPDTAIGAAIAALRAAAGMSQQELADRMRDLGWRWVQPTVHSLEQGRRPLRLAEADDLARLLGVELQALLAPPDTDPVDDLVLGTHGEADALRRRRDEAERQQRSALDRGAALVDLQRARRGEAVEWTDVTTRVWDALGWLDPERLRKVVEHFGVPPERAGRIVDRQVEAVAQLGADPTRAEDVRQEFADHAWEALTQALPSLTEADQS